jgi:hypothetical protein
LATIAVPASGADLPILNGRVPQNDLSLLNRTDPECLRDFAGDFVKDGHSAAVILIASGKNVCLLTSTEASQLRQSNGTLIRLLPESNGFISYEIISSSHRYHLLKIGLNLGGSLTQISYIVVTVVARARGPFELSQSEVILLADFILPPDVQTDQEAREKAWQKAAGH